MSKIKELWFCKELIDREKAAALNGKSGYYSVSDNIFSEGHSMFTRGIDYYTEAKAIFDCDVPSGILANYTTLMIVKFSDTTNLSALFLPSGGYPGVDYDSSNYYWRNPLTCIGDGYRYDLTSGELIYNTHYQSANTWTTYAAIDFMIYNTAQLDMYYNGGDRNINYANIDNLQGYGPGGWQVPNPNPTHKIMLNGQQPNDIKLNGATPLKIMLNGVCYFEKQSGGGYLYNWDLTSSAVDPVTSTELQYYLNDSSDTTANVATKSGLYTSGTGVTFSDQSDVNGIVLPVNLYTPGNVLEVDFTNFQVTYTMMDWGQFFVETHKCQNTYDSDYGIHWGVGGDYNSWFLTCNYNTGADMSYGYYSITNSIEQNLFENSTLKIKVIESPNQHPQWEIYKNDNLIATTPDVNTWSGYPFMPSSMPDAENLFILSPHYLNATVTGIRISQS